MDYPSPNDVAICIVNYNTRDFLENCLRSVFEQTKGLDFEVIVVDNGSSDGSTQMVKEMFPHVKLILNERNLGFTKANNQAIKTSNSKYILLLNSDTILISDHVIKDMVDFMNHHGEAGAVSCRTLRGDMTIQPTSYNSPSLWLLLFHFLNLKKLVPTREKWRRLIVRVFGRLLEKNVYSYLDDLQLSAPREVNVVGGACLFFRRAVIESVGYFDENIFLGPDDYDWCLRLKKKGWRIFLLPTPGVVHYVGQSMLRSFGQVPVGQYQGLFYFYRKHFGRKATLTLKVLVPPILIAKCAWLFITIPFSGQKKRGQRRRLIHDYMKVAELAAGGDRLPDSGLG